MRVFLLAVIALALVVPSTVHAQGAPAKPDWVIGLRTADGEIALVWTPVPAATGYIVYRGPSLVTLQPIAMVTASFFIDTSPAPGVVWYGVASTDGVGTSDPHEFNAGHDGANCVDSNGGKVAVNAQACTSGG